MKLQSMMQSWQSALIQNRILSILVGILLLANLLLAIATFKRDTILVISPPTLTSEAELSRSQATENYLTSWALYFAELIGNVTPGNVAFIQTALEPLLAPNIYDQVMGVLAMQAHQIRDDRVTLKFQPRQIEIQQDKTGAEKVYVTGYSFVSGASGQEQRELRTYEFIIRIEHYAPVLIWVDTYEGQPRLPSKNDEHTH